MSALRSRNAALLAKIEAVEGDPETLNASSDGVLVSELQVNLTPQNEERGEVTGSLDDRGPLIGGLQAEISFDVYLKGSGTPGTAPEFGKLFQACGWGEVVTSAAVPAAAEACGAGGSTTTAELGSSASSTAQAYRGMPITFSDEVEGTSFISNYTTSKIATLTDTFAAIDTDTKYQIPVNVLYKPISSSIPSLTLAAYIDGVVWTIAGARGTFTLTFTAGRGAKASFRFTGMFISKADAAVPSPTYQTTTPPIWRNNRMFINRAAAAVASFTFDNGNTLIYPENPNATQGFETSIITARSMRGTLDPQLTLVATRNILADLQAGTERIVHATLGSAAGNRVGFTAPTALFEQANPGDRNGIAIEQVSCRFLGQDSGAFLCFY